MHWGELVHCDDVDVLVRDGWMNFSRHDDPTVLAPATRPRRAACYYYCKTSIVDLVQIPLPILNDKGLILFWLLFCFGAAHDDVVTTVLWQ